MKIIEVTFFLFFYLQEFDMSLNYIHNTISMIVFNLCIIFVGYVWAIKRS